MKLKTPEYEFFYGNYRELYKGVNYILNLPDKKNIHKYSLIQMKLDVFFYSTKVDKTTWCQNIRVRYFK